jgi:hypothetical protein
MAKVNVFSQLTPVCHSALAFIRSLGPHAQLPCAQSTALDVESVFGMAAPASMDGLVMIALLLSAMLSTIATGTEHALALQYEKEACKEVCASVRSATKEVMIALQVDAHWTALDTDNAHPTWSAIARMDSQVMHAKTKPVLMDVNMATACSPPLQNFSLLLLHR